jgi:LEA14-like dessication related protein
LSTGSRLSGLFLIIVLLVLAGVIFYNEATTAERSSSSLGISLSQFQFTGVQAVNGSGSSIIVQFTIKDATPVGGTLGSAIYDLYADGSYVGRGSIEQPVKIPADGSVTVSTALFLPVAGSVRGLWFYFLDVGNVSWRAVGNATLDQSVLGEAALHFDCLSAPGYSSISCSYVLS